MKDTAALFESELKNLPLVHRGKVRDIYGIDDDHLLIVASDRLSAFDVVLPTPIPGKGRVLTAISTFWFNRLRHIMPNHLADRQLEEVLADPAERARVQGRAMVVRRAEPLPIEAIVRGYLIGSGWKDYRRGGALCGMALPPGLRQADKLPEPIFTPSTKAQLGAHDENISLARAGELIGDTRAARVRDLSLQLYREASTHAAACGIIIADSKFEFGIDRRGTLMLIDELFTPDSSRFWPAESYQPGTSPPSFDKQFVRDYLETLTWDKRAPGPALPAEVVEKTARKYQEALERLTAVSVAAARR